jgi:DNA (cytosine-5)-methyltransferase 1
MRNGLVYEQPTQVRLTTVSESLSSPIFPTPTTQDNSGICRDHGGDLLHDVICGCARSERKNLMPTPKALDGIKGNLKTSQERIDSGHFVDLTNVAIDLMPIPQVDDSKNTGHNQDRRPTLASEVWETQRTTNWGKFEPAIRRWEQVLGRVAPAPTKPDGKDGAHRLSSSFTEWMMGLPEGWITGHGLSRNDELKMAGNGVVPQQAELALRILLEGIDLNSVLPDAVK